MSTRVLQGVPSAEPRRPFSVKLLTEERSQLEAIARTRNVTLAQALRDLISQASEVAAHRQPVPWHKELGPVVDIGEEWFEFGEALEAAGRWDLRQVYDGKLQADGYAELWNAELDHAWSVWRRQRREGGYGGVLLNP